MTEEQASAVLREFLAKDGRVILTGYYKYIFHFGGKRDDIAVELSFGGNADDIYKYEPPLEPFNVNPDLDYLKEWWSYIKVKKGTDEFSWHIDY